MKEDSVPISILEITEIKGVGPKMARRVHEELGVVGLGDIQDALEKGKLSKVKGFGEKMIEKVKEHIVKANQNKSKKKRNLTSRWTKHHPFGTSVTHPACEGCAPEASADGSLGTLAQEGESLAMTTKPTPDYSLRAACVSDVPFLVALRETTMGSIIRRHQLWIPDEQTVRVLYRLDCAYVVTHRAQDIGLWKVASDSTLTDLIQIQLLPAFQRLGIGSHLIGRLQAECRLAMRPITLHVLALNPAFTLYQRLGFQVAERDEHSFQMLWQPTPLRPSMSSIQEPPTANKTDAVN